jgi:hypothetical protein
MPSPRNPKNRRVVTIEHGGTAKTVIGGVNEMINSIINYSKFFVVGWFLRGEMAEE